MLGFDPGAAAPLGLASLVEGHVPLPARRLSSVYGRSVGVVAVFLKSLPELAVVCKLGLGGDKKKLKQ